VEAYHPRPGEEVPLDAQLTWTFDQPVDPGTFTGALRIVPALEGALHWVDARTAVLSPASLTPGVRYAVSLSTDVESEAGLQLTEGLDYTFSALAPLQVTRTTPSPGARDLRSDTAVVLEFNYPVVSANCVGDAGHVLTSCPQLPLTFAPPVMGSGYWANTSRYVFESLTGFDAGRAYETTLAGQVISVGGASLANAYVWSFETAAPRIDELSPEPGATQVGIDAGVRVVFNTPMDTEATAGELVVTTDTGEVVPGTVTWSDDGAGLVFQPLVPWTLDTTYQVRLGPRARAVGSAPLPPTQPWAFRTVGQPELVEHVPVDGATGVGVHVPLQLTFAGAIDEATVRSGVRITSTEGSTDVFGVYDAASGVYSVSWERTPRTEYCVAVSADIRDVYGNTLSAPSRFCFETGDLPAMVEPAAALNAATLDAGWPAEMGFLVRNAEEVAFSLAALDVPAFLQGQDNGGEVLRAWTEAIDAAPNALANAGVSLQPGDGLLPTGLYHLTWEVPGTIGNDRSIPIAVIDRHVMVKLSDHDALVWVTDLATGAPISRTEVQLLDHEGLLVAGGTTDRDGLARLPISDSGDGSLWRTLAAVTGQAGQPGYGIALTEWQGDAAPWQFGVLTDVGPLGQYRAFLLTDRLVYRPGQNVKIAGLLREDVGGIYRLPQTSVTTTLALMSRDGEAVDRLGVVVGATGRFSNTIVLPDTLASGNYVVSLSLPGAHGGEPATLVATTIQVVLYREPDYWVNVEPDAADVFQGEDVVVLIETGYLAGGVASDATVTWAVYAEPYRFGPGSGGAPSPDSWHWQSPSPSYRRRLVAQGVGVTDDGGALMIRLSADLARLGEDSPATSQHWVIEARVTDASGFPVSGTGDLVVHSTDVYLGLQPASRVVRPKERLALGVKAVSWDGTAVSELDIDLQLVRRTWYQASEPVTWAYTDTVVSEQSATTSVEGQAEVAFTAPRSGLYVVKAATTGESRRLSSSELSLWVGGDEGDGWRNRDAQLELVTDAEAYQVGDVAKVLVPANLDGVYQVLVTVERNGVISAERHVFDTPNPILEIPILETYVPNVYVSCVVVQPATETAPARGMVGYTELAVDPAAQLLSVDVEARGGLYGPGEMVELVIRTEDHQGNPIEADVTLAVVDHAASALTDWSRPSLSTVFYGNRPLRVLTGDGLLVAADLGVAALPQLDLVMPGELGATASLGVRGDAEDASAQDEVVPRRNFVDTAYWTTELRTDVLGTATAVFTLPTSLTTWDVRAWAVTPDSKVGEGQATLAVEKPLFLRPVTPRFLVVGDKTEVATLVHNTLDEDRVVQVGLSVDSGLRVATPELKQITVGAGSLRRISWPVEVLQSPDGVAQMTFTARSGALADASRPTYGTSGLEGIPIAQALTSDPVGFSGSVAPGGVSIEVVDVPVTAGDGTALQLRLRPSFTSVLLDSPLLAQTCRKQVDACANQLLPAVARFGALARQPENTADPSSYGAGEGSDVEGIAEALAWLYIRQSPDGGWGWWRDSSNLHLTSYVVHALQCAETAGFAVRPDRMEAALSYVTETIARGMAAELRHPHYALGLRVLSEAGWPWPQGAGSGLYSDRQELGLEGRAHLAVAYNLQDPSDTRIATLLDEIRSEAVVRDKAVHWEEIDPERWTTSVQLTAVIVDALAVLEPDAEELTPAIEWLLATRSGAFWSTAYENAWALSALARYVELRGDPVGEAGMVRVTLNGQPVSLPQNVADPDQSAVGAVLRLGAEEDDEGLLRGTNVLEIGYESGADQALTYTGLLDLVLTVDSEVPAQSRGLALSRRYCLRTSETIALQSSKDSPCVPAERVSVGQLVDVRLLVTVPETRHFVELEDPYPAGFEAVYDDRGLLSLGSAAGPELGNVEAASDSRDTLSRSSFLPAEIGETAAVFLAERLPAGTYEVVYTLRAAIPGSYRALSATAAERFFPEVRAQTVVDQVAVVAQLAD
ncbi:MAG: Ig-like domain-containing protein, partial [Anaerolineae bacterium]|nr:Ig-like domain-containing protein [Anaerolineae bacterium]